MKTTYRLIAAAALAACSLGAYAQKGETVKIAWIDLDENEAKRRMEKRADPRDEYKLKHWDQYTQRRLEPPEHSAIQRFNNLHFDDAKFEELINHLVQ